MQNERPDDLDIAPYTSILRAIVHSDLGWRNALAELIDNAFDAGATRVVIKLGPNRKGRPEFLVFEDDGWGCKSLTVTVRLGDHDPHKSTQLGRYGIGLKDAVLWLGGETSVFTVTSIHAAIWRRLRVDWAQVIRSRSWRLDSSFLSQTDAEPGARGTSIMVKPICKKLPHGAAWSDLVSDIGYLYSPAIKRGRQITIQRSSGEPEPVQRYELPDLEEGHVDTRISVDGKGARVYVGIVKSLREHRRRGITYVHGFRVIKRASGNGCRNYDVSRIAGFVELDETWELTKNKDGISAYEDDLYDAVFDKIEPLLKRAESIGQTIESAEFITAIEGTLNRALRAAAGDEANAKAKRGKGEKSGTKNPTGRGSKHQRAREEQNGSTFLRAKSGGIRVRINPFAEGDERLGRFDVAGTVYLSAEHPFIARLVTAKNNDAIAGLALCICLNSEVVAPKGQRLLKLPESTNDMEDRFTLALGRVCARAVHNGVSLSLVQGEAAE